MARHRARCSGPDGTGPILPIAAPPFPQARRVGCRRRPQRFAVEPRRQPARPFRPAFRLAVAGSGRCRPAAGRLDHRHRSRRIGMGLALVLARAGFCVLAIAGSRHVRLSDRHARSGLRLDIATVVICYGRCGLPCCADDSQFVGTFADAVQPGILAVFHGGLLLVGMTALAFVSHASHGTGRNPGALVRGVAPLASWRRWPKSPGRFRNTGGPVDDPRQRPHAGRER